MSSFRRRSNRYVARAKRNSERVVRAGQTAVATGTQGAAYTYTATQPCTVRSIKLDLGMITAAAGDANVPYVLVVVREGYNVNQINYPAITDDLYNPTMDVLISGVLTDNTVEDHKFNSIGRKLKTGDRICLVLAAFGSAGQTIVTFEMSFSVLS